ncbi:MAG TPA: hypothetical protein VMW27_17200 [Thermoanaerobaculia bacterium]|nr:hypothetical protein [Thermoanaerobaculia bacterium]
MKKALLPISCAALLASLACSGHPKPAKPGTGDIAFRLLWTGTSDLDLYVEDPAGSCIYFLGRRSESGGILDIDCNAGEENMCPQPIENVYWPTGTAPPGTYKFWVNTNSLLPSEVPIPFELQLLRGRKVVWRHTGVIQKYEEIFGPLLYDTTAGRNAVPIPGPPLEVHPLIRCRAKPPEQLPNKTIR